MLPIISPVVAGKQIFKADDLCKVDIVAHRANAAKQTKKQTDDF